MPRSWENFKTRHENKERGMRKCSRLTFFPLLKKKINHTSKRMIRNTIGSKPYSSCQFRFELAFFFNPNDAYHRRAGFVFLQSHRSRRIGEIGEHRDSSEEKAEIGGSQSTVRGYNLYPEETEISSANRCFQSQNAREGKTV